MRVDTDSAILLKEKIKRIAAAVSSQVPEVEVEGLMHRQGMISKTGHQDCS